MGDALTYFAMVGGGLTFQAGLGPNGWFTGERELI